MVQGSMMLGTVISQVLVARCSVLAEVFLGVAASEPPEMHVHGFEHLVHHGLVGHACNSGVVALNGRRGLWPDHINESVPQGYHGLGTDEEA